MKNLISFDLVPKDIKHLIETAIETGVLPSINVGEERYISCSQLERVTARILENKTKCKLSSQNVFVEEARTFHINPDIKIYRELIDNAASDPREILVPLFFAERDGEAGGLKKSVRSIDVGDSGCCVETSDESLVEYLQNSLEKYAKLEERQNLAFSGSASYQGSKAKFVPIIDSIVNTYCNEGAYILDLMCGAGAVGGALSGSWKVVASDLQKFSCRLAQVQGGGFSLMSAKLLLSDLSATFDMEFEKVADFKESDIQIEDEFLATELSQDLVDEFIDWLNRFPSIADSDNLPEKYLQALSDRKLKNWKTPGLLFSIYYANLFFGVRQAAEIDALRISINSIKDEKSRDWALGALTATVSYCAYNFAGHFAQPKLNLDRNNINTSWLAGILKKRSISVFHEFSARLLSLANASSDAKYQVDTVDGPWMKSIESFESFIPEGSDALVYFDPPYTRDEYSRYYHVLETLSIYNYPDVSGKALLPLKGTPGRLYSPFSTRSATDIEKLLTNIMSECLLRGWKVLWSYSSTGVADIVNVLKELDSIVSTIDIYNAAHKYSPQGEKKAKEVIEYFIVLTPGDVLPE